MIGVSTADYNKLPLSFGIYMVGVSRTYQSLKRNIIGRACSCASEALF